MDWVSGIHPEDRDRTVKAFESSLLGENRFNNQYRIVGKQTFEIKHLDVFGQHFKNRLGITTRTIGVTINVSEHKLKQESELVEKALDMQRSKTLALGELAAGIGHEINNPLSILTGNLDLLKKSLRDNSNSPGPKQQLANISQCAERIQNITSGLRRLVRDGTYEALSVIDVNEVARTTVNLLKEIYAKQGISVVIELGQACNVKGHFSELQQVLLNLISNARGAVSKSASKHINVSITTIDKRVCIQVSDSGIGIREEKQKLIFESLYTQKPSGQGTGLGLGICKRIVTEHGGSIEVDSRLGQGATFKVLLPLYSEVEAAQDKQANLTAEVPNIQLLHANSNDSEEYERSDANENYHILVVDDEPMILEIVQVYLEQQGYQVTCRESLVRAKQAIDSHHFDLVLTDVCMPDGEGTELLVYAEKRSPSTKIAIMTGGVYDEDLRSRYPTRLVGYLYKPFTETKLLEFIARIVEGENGYTTV